MLNGEIRPGKVLEVVDNYGVVKASCCGLFSELDDTEKLPPVRPFLRVSPSSFVKPNVGDDIWVMFFADNPQELFYMFQGCSEKTNTTYLGDVDPSTGENYEILAKHGDDDDPAVIQYSDKEGWNMKCGETGMNISPDKTVTIGNTTDQSESFKGIIIDDNYINLCGNDNTDNTQPAVLGTELTKCLNNLVDLLMQVSTVCKSDPNTAHIAVAIESKMGEFVDSIDPIKSKNVVLD
ncbi:MAG: hypothetical protein IIZ78_20750 [Clostridiales bacterium]|nr:hypothetical protein [Clostridiales bacterium]